MRHIGPRRLAYGALVAALTAMLVAAAGCGGGGSGSALQEGVYLTKITEQYLRQNGISAVDAKANGGDQTVTLRNGSFTDAWRNGANEDIFCSGTYKDADGTVTFTWISGCFGDWSARYAIDGDQVSWSDVKALPPHDTAEDQRQVEVYNAVPWTRTGDVPSS